MVNMIENWAEITGEITYIRRDHSRPGFHLITIRLGESKNYRSFPNLIRPTRRNTLTISIPKEELENMELKKGDVISTRVRAAPLNTYFLHPPSLEVIK